MAYSKPATGNGLTFAWGTTTAYDGWEVIDANLDGVSVGDIDTSNLATAEGTARTYIPTEIFEGGTLTLNTFADVDIPPEIVHATETLTISNVPITDSANTTKGSISVPVYIQSYDSNFSNDEAMRHTVVLKIAGDITYTDSSS